MCAMDLRVGRPAGLTEFTDSILRHIFDYLDPLPDGFALAATCKVCFWSWVLALGWPLGGRCLRLPDATIFGRVVHSKILMMSKTSLSLARCRDFTTC